MERELDNLHHPQMTVVEEGLKLCLEQRKDLSGKVLSGREMAEYILWMIEKYGGENDTDIINGTMPTMLLGGGIAEVGRSILNNGKDMEAKKRVVSLYESPQESSFFQEMQDISGEAFTERSPASAGRLMRSPEASP